MLTPTQACELATAVYDAATSTAARGAFSDAGIRRLKGRSAKVLKGTTGYSVIKRQSVCAMKAVVVRNNTKHLILVFRGTVVTKIGDLLTNANSALAINESGQRVHGGFNRLANDIEIDLDKLASIDQNYSTIHVVGHSLGGAVATLISNALRSKRPSLPVVLYTFGSPRVGVDLFAQEFTKRIPESMQRRVFHSTDPIPTVPIFPFAHAPSPGMGIGIDTKKF